MTTTEAVQRLIWFWVKQAWC